MAQPNPAVAVSPLILPATRSEIKFEWKGDTIHSRWEPYNGMLLPVKLAGCSRQLYMQFDLGSPYSLLYRNKLNDIRATYPAAVAPDTASTLKNFRFTIGKMPVLAKEIVVQQFNQDHIDRAETHSIEIIGTIGTDFIDNRITVIDYPNKKILTAPDMPSFLQSSYQLSDFIYAGGSVLLPSIIKGKKTLLYFDTGSSAFELLTDLRTFEALSIPGATPMQYPVKSWNKILTAHTIATNDSVDIAFTRIPIQHASYIEGASSKKVDEMMKMGIGGMTGNKLFLPYRLLLDTKHKKFGLYHSSGKRKE